jgi:hypothetical protein
LIGADVKMSIDQVDPLLDEGDTRTLSEQTSDLLLLLCATQRKSNSNSKSLFTEDENRARSLMAAYLLPGGRCLSYIIERRAFTVPVAEVATGVERNLIHSIVRRLMRGGVLHERFRVGGHGRPTSIYAVFDASDGQVEEAAALYRDQNATHVKRLDDYLVDNQYKVIAEEIVQKHLTREGKVRAPVIARVLGEHGIKGEAHRDNARQLIISMGYEVTY